MTVPTTRAGGVLKVLGLTVAVCLLGLRKGTAQQASPAAPQGGVPWYLRPAGLLLPLAVWCAGQFYTQKLEFARQSAEAQWSGYREIIEVASAVVEQLDYQEQPPAAAKAAGPDDLGQLIRNYERLYWARMGLVTAAAASACMKQLHDILIDDVRKWPNIPEHPGEIRNLRTAIYEASTVLREDYRRKANSFVPWILLSGGLSPFDGSGAACPASRDRAR